MVFEECTSITNIFHDMVCVNLPKILLDFTKLIRLLILFVGHCGNVFVDIV